ncbi:hypothetical protein BDZ89DRAFT_1157917 [Hymenopellis radicata]|nr:hypothetical protein BDZ89DRAFT_1157917 [Hymenopellis radicata]
MTELPAMTPEATRILDSLSSLSPEELKLVAQQSVARAETTVLRKSLPDFLQPYAETISVREPATTTTLSRELFGELMCDSGFKFDGSRASFCITSQQGEHLLEISCESWEAGSVGLSMDGEKTAVSFKRRVSSFSSDSPGISSSAYSSKGLKDIMKDVVGDMGFKGELPSGEMFLEIVVALVGTKGEAFLRNKARYAPTENTYTPLLSEVVKDDLEGQEDNDPFGF